MFVATMHLRTPRGAAWKILPCKSAGSCEYIEESTNQQQPRHFRFSLSILF